MSDKCLCSKDMFVIIKSDNSNQFVRILSKEYNQLLLDECKRLQKQNEVRYNTILRNIFSHLKIRLFCSDEYKLWNKQIPLVILTMVGAESLPTEQLETIHSNYRYTIADIPEYAMIDKILLMNLVNIVFQSDAIVKLTMTQKCSGVMEDLLFIGDEA